MVKLITDLHGNVAGYAQYCIRNYSLDTLARYAKDGIDTEACEVWGISGEEWQDVIFAVLKELRGTPRF